MIEHALQFGGEYPVVRSLLGGAIAFFAGWLLMTWWHIWRPMHLADRGLIALAAVLFVLTAAFQQVERVDEPLCFCVVVQTVAVLVGCSGLALLWRDGRRRKG